MPLNTWKSEKTINPQAKNLRQLGRTTRLNTTKLPNPSIKRCRNASTEASAKASYLGADETRNYSQKAKIMTTEITTSNLAQFSGTEQYYKHWLGLKLTDGAQFLNANGAGWLIDAIASYQTKTWLASEPMLRDMQFWKLTVHADETATLICERDTDDIAITQEIGYTDFPLESITLYLTDGVILLPSEY